jgi:hypothetical protein
MSDTKRSLSRLEFEVLREAVVQCMLLQSDVDGWIVDPDSCYRSFTIDTALETVENILAEPVSGVINEDEELTWRSWKRAVKLEKLQEARETLVRLYRGFPAPIALQLGSP